MEQVFISYSRKDALIVRSIAFGLEQQKVSVWIDHRSIADDVDRDEAVEQAIEEARYFVLALSAHTQDSEHVKRELERAEALNKEVVPILIDNLDVADFSPQFTRHQYIDFYGNFTQAMQTLVARLKSRKRDTQVIQTSDEPITIPTRPSDEQWPGSLDKGILAQDRVELPNLITFPEDKQHSAYPKLEFSLLPSQRLYRRWVMRILSVTIGRAHHCDIVLNNKQISRTHARIYLDEGAYWLEDLDSINGTWRNGKPVQGAPVQLYNDDRIVMGQVIAVRFILIDEEQDEPTFPGAGKP